MINPQNLIAAIVGKLAPYYSTIGITAAAEITDEPSRALRPPYIGFYFDYDRNADQRSLHNVPVSLPVGVYAFIFSGPAKSPALAFQQVFAILEKVKPLIPGRYTISGASIDLEWQDRPWEISSIRSDGAIMKLNLLYEDIIYD
jgi:hypothetical protein